ncbi:MAG TPA: hypothetical protein VGP66_07270 [Candidatus Acidoferrum sp.]|jgi:hypothetical protein|nr:hypothetical protein [Candidatus Acidoferrum sp.]
MARTRQQKELMALAALVLIAGLVWYFHLGRSAGPGSGLSTSNYSPINAQDYNVIINGLAKAQSTEYKSAGRNIFVMGAMPVDPAKQGPVKKPFVSQGPQPPAPPPPAQLPMVFFGYGMLPAGGAREAFLKEEQGDAVFIVSEGDVVLNHIRILHIGNDKIDFEDTTTGQRGSKNLEAAPTA